MRRCITIFVAFILLAFMAAPAQALNVLVANIAGGQVQVAGVGAGKNQSIYWEGTQVTKSDKLGLFYFSTTNLPIDCVGQLQSGTGTPINVVINGCTTGGGVPKTGQTDSYYPGDDGNLQKGVPWPDPRFTDHGDGTITDNLTGLMWTKNAQQINYETTWFSAIEGCNNSVFAVYNDWRLPNLRELQSLIDYGAYEFSIPSLPAGHPFTGVYPNYYWTSTTFRADVGWVFIVNFETGTVGYIGWQQSFGVKSWCTRGGR